ncbi:hypothetical protein BGZ65_005654 [Modicella reniformis]|uniref:F-box domain-containing protein n=1 Tax=Modicella reniformis TaxID=1440133 RepID=A0A9P6J793_9FUNG|nr:hypothetical protein BGZ65_005654 [Modicella reniformis]
MPDWVSMLAIPHIIEVISLKLDRDDVKSCMAVNKAWGELFRPWLWCEFTFEMKSSKNQLIDIVSKSHITELTPWLYFRPHRSWMKHLLQNLPKTLKSLFVQWGRVCDFEDPEIVVPQDWHWPDAYPSLEKADFSTYLSIEEEEPLFEFLKRCPALKEFSVPKNKPILNWIAFNTQTTKGFIEALTKSWFTTLELLLIEPRCIASRDIQLILTSCSRLRTFDCLCPWPVESFEVKGLCWEKIPGLEAMVKSDSDDELCMKDWVCLDLEELQLTFADGRRVQAEDHILSSQEEWTIQGIDYAYRQLGRLTKLRELTIGWLTTKYFASCANFDMSLQAGLQHMEKLKSLQTLDISYINSVNVGMAEVQWMANSWPELKRTSGLKRRFTSNNQSESSDMECPRRGWLRRLLQNVPRTLKSLDVRWGGWNEEYGMDYFPIQDWPETYPCLQSANFAIDLIDDEQTVLAQFLTRCPSLKKLTLPTVERSEILSQVVTLLGSRESFPSLEVLDLGLNGQVDEHTWELLLLLMKGRIKGVAFCVPFSAPITRSFIGRMIQYWSETLETIHIGQPLSVAGSDIHLILTTCPKLKRFVCMHNRVVWPLVRPGDTPDAFPRQEAITNNGNNGGAAMENWICLELEELKLMFRDGRRARVDEPVLQEGPTIMAIRYAYQQVGRLTRLKDLVIGWRTTKAFANCANLDMSLKSGLGYMSDLKAMRMIDINHIYEVKLGMEEVQWMVENWPSLREIRGLEYQIDNVKEDECIEWLRTTRPDIIIQ